MAMISTAPVCLLGRNRRPRDPGSVNSTSHRSLEFPPDWRIAPCCFLRASSDPNCKVIGRVLLIVSISDAYDAFARSTDVPAATMPSRSSCDTMPRWNATLPDLTLLTMANSLSPTLARVQLMPSGPDPSNVCRKWLCISTSGIGAVAASGECTSTDCLSHDASVSARDITSGCWLGSTGALVLSKHGTTCS